MERVDAIDLHPSLYIIDLLAKFYMSAPKVEDLKNLKKFLEFLDGEFEDLHTLTIKAVVDEEILKDIVESFYHFFEIHSACLIDMHESSYYFKHIQPDYLHPVLSKLNISFKLKGGKFPDHLSNQLLIFAFIYSEILYENDDKQKRLLQKLLRQFFHKHLNKFLREIEGKIKQCTCNYKTDFYPQLIEFTIFVVEDFMSNTDVVDT